jgi:hypothetical protein
MLGVLQVPNRQLRHCIPMGDLVLRLTFPYFLVFQSQVSSIYNDALQLQSVLIRQIAMRLESPHSQKHRLRMGASFIV